ncbi:MAG: hypothetical protein M3441_22110 [Chloroflexota bacterium]|nr:hypothetical protein [Chloroflexota bacterium]
MEADVERILKAIANPPKLEKDLEQWKGWSPECLLSKQISESPGMPVYQALRQVYAEILQLLRDENESYADLLYGRFWEKLTVDAMLSAGRPYSMSERAFFNIRQAAIKRFSQILFEQENVCSGTTSVGVPTDQSGDVVGDGHEQDNISSEEVLRTLPVKPQAPVKRNPLWIRLLIVGSLFLISLSTLFLLVRPSVTIPLAVCGETRRFKVQNAGQFLRHQGVSSFTTESSTGAVLNDKIRSLAIDQRGLWIGYFVTDQNPANGIGHYNRESWTVCGVPGEGAAKNINGLALDSKGRVWAAAEKGGVLMFDGRRWRNYTVSDGLPTLETFGITVDKDDQVWAATWEGVAKLDGDRWILPYHTGSGGKGTLFNNHTHAIAFDDSGNIWVAHMGRGVSQYSKADGKWIHRTSEKGELGGDLVFGIAVRNADVASPESVWFATSNGVSKYEAGGWRTYHISDGLPDDRVQAVAIDPHNRVWAATAGGVAYLDGQTWVTYNTIPTLSIAFGPACSRCPYDSDHVWTGTESMGLTHSRLPLPLSIQAIDVISVRYRKVDTPDEPFRDEIVVAPGEEVLAEITVSPRPPYTLTNQRGDLLANLEEDEEKRFGAYVQIAVDKTVESGQRYTFTDYDKPFKAPQLPEGVHEQKFTTRYRVWMYTRYVGPVIEVTLTVRRPAANTASTTPP